MEAAISTIIIALITAVLGPSILEWVKYKFTKRMASLPEAIQHNELIDHQLEIILKELECDRITVSQFHNGGHFYPTGKSIQKFSIFYERTSPDVISIQHTFQNIPLSLFSKSLAKLYRDGELSIHNFDIDDTFDLTHYHTEYGVKSFYMMSIDDLDGQFIGVLAIAFNKEHVLTKDEWILLRQKVGVLGTILTKYLGKKSNK